MTTTERPALTPRQREIFDFIRSRRPVPPSVREIGARFGINSPNGVMCHLRALEKKGVIRRDARLARSIEVVDSQADAMRALITADPQDMDGSEIVIGAYRFKLTLIGPEG